MANNSESASILSCLTGRLRDFYLTTNSTMLGGYELGGIDPTGLGERERRFATALLRSLIQSSPPDLTLTQYYIHRYSPEVQLKIRTNKRSNVVSKRREVFLQNKRKLCDSKILFIPELPFAHNLTTLKTFDFFQNLVSFPVSKEARNYVKTRFSNKNAYLVYEDDLKDTYHQLDEEIQNHLARLNLTSFGNKKLTGSELWKYFQSLYSFDFDYLNLGAAPSKNNLNGRIFSGDVTPVTYKNVDLLKFSGLRTVYVRLASIKGFSDEYICEGFYSCGINSVVGTPGNYIIMNRYRGFNRASQDKYFHDVENEVARNQVNIMDMVQGNDNKSLIEKQLTMSEKDKAILQEVQNSQSLSDYHGKFESVIAVFSEDRDEILETSKTLRAALNQSGADIVWESAGLESALEVFLPGSQYESKRGMVINSSKASALSLYYKSSNGLPTWEYSSSKGKVEEESFYIFESSDGTPFHYTPYIGGKCMTIGIGPIRSGKTFTKNTLATHFMKFGGLYTAIDIDPGTESIAKFFQDDGAIFRLDDDFQQGFNPFYVSGGEKDTAFRAHFARQLQLMVQSNSNEEMQRFTKDEQHQLDEAMLSTLKLPQEMRTFKSFLDHCNSDIRLKLSRFVGEGMYSNLYDNEKDAIGSLKKRFSVYNIMGVKNDPVALPLTMSEIVYRVLRTFENPKIRDFFKLLDIDECHSFLAIPGMAEFLVKGIRTWGKWNAGVSLWTQSPAELKRVPDWPAIRSAASTFWFMADGEMDRDSYRNTFNLSDGHLDAIESLIPKQQAFIYQPEIRVAKVINIWAEPEQRVINSSVAGETMLFLKNLELFDDIDVAIQKTAQQLNFL